MCAQQTHGNTDLLNALHLSWDGRASHAGQTAHLSLARDPEEASSHQEVEKPRKPLAKILNSEQNAHGVNQEWEWLRRFLLRARKWQCKTLIPSH